MNTEEKKDAVKVGPFEIINLTVSEGLHLLSLANDENRRFQSELLIACVRKDGKKIDDLNMSEFMPHMGKVVSKAMELNGFKAPEDNKDDANPNAEGALINGSLA